MPIMQNVIAASSAMDVLVSVVTGGITGLYLLMLGFVAIFGIHRWVLVFLYYRHRHQTPKITQRFTELPKVTVQLPMYNELYVAERIIDSVCAFDYPADKLQIQVLDDSTDETRNIAQKAVQRHAAQGIDIVYIHRQDRTGFKAGALDNGLKTATGEFIVVFDADFVPKPDMLQHSIHYFTDEKIGMVQVRWDHINRDQSLLTRGQAILLDGHFVIEHAARSRSGRFMNFNGTAGIWRRICIEQGGGWQHDTLTEDLDLSYRCQLAGWRFIFLSDVTSPAELPPEIQGFKQQQFRWTKGAVQTAKKLLPRILCSKSLSWRVKLEASFHLLNPMSYLFMSILMLLLLPVFAMRISAFGDQATIRSLLDFSLFVIGSCSASTFYMCSQREIFHSWYDKVLYLPFLMSLGVGMGLNNGRGVLEALFGKDTAFERTPKFGVASDEKKNAWHKKAGSFARKPAFMPFIELAYGVYMTVCTVLCIKRGGYALICCLPFLITFTFGYYYVGFLSLQATYSSMFRRSKASEDILESSAV
ncbi:MAG: glycosyltransferase family 2 protein [Sedimentisphaerales bacterium]|nr:glycosyltransferase family 2 protein [Sedimentisphaerales bacterium]